VRKHTWIIVLILSPHGLRAEDGPGGNIIILIDTAADKNLPATGRIRGFMMVGGNPIGVPDTVIKDISVATPSGPATTAIELTTLNARLLTQGSFNAGRGQWFVSARAWYPDAIISAVRDSSNEVFTDYYDVLAKVQHQIGRRSTPSANLLVAYDDLGFHGTDAAQDVVQTTFINVIRERSMSSRATRMAPGSRAARYWPFSTGSRSKRDLRSASQTARWNSWPPPPSSTETSRGLRPPRRPR